jgi:hypothetical protein
VAAVTKATVEVTIGAYHYEARLDGNRVELFRDGASAGEATWGGQRIEDFPKSLSKDAEDALNRGIIQQLQKSWRAEPENRGKDERENANGPFYDVATGAENTPDAGNRGQMGNETDKPNRQGEKEVGAGGPGGDPNTGELGGQAIKPSRRAEGDGFKPTGEDQSGTDDGAGEEDVSSEAPTRRAPPRGRPAAR